MTQPFISYSIFTSSGIIWIKEKQNAIKIKQGYHQGWTQGCIRCLKNSELVHGKPSNDSQIIRIFSHYQVVPNEMTCFLLCLFHFCYLRLKKRTDELFLISWFPLPLLLFSLSRWRHVKCYNLRLIMYSLCVSDPFHGVLRNPKVWGSIPYGNLFFCPTLVTRRKTFSLFVSYLFVSLLFKR